MSRLDRRFEGAWVPSTVVWPSRALPCGTGSSPVCRTVARYGPRRFGDRRGARGTDRLGWRGGGRTGWSRKRRGRLKKRDSGLRERWGDGARELLGSKGFNLSQPGAGGDAWGVTGARRGPHSHIVGKREGLPNGIAPLCTSKVGGTKELGAAVDLGTRWNQLRRSAGMRADNALIS